MSCSLTAHLKRRQKSHLRGNVFWCFAMGLASGKCWFERKETNSGRDEVFDSVAVSVKRSCLSRKIKSSLLPFFASHVKDTWTQNRCTKHIARLFLLQEKETVMHYVAAKTKSKWNKLVLFKSTQVASIMLKSKRSSVMCARVMNLNRIRAFLCKLCNYSSERVPLWTQNKGVLWWEHGTIRISPQYVTQ